MNKLDLLKKLDDAKTALVVMEDFKLAMAVRDAADRLQREIAAEDDAGPPKRASLLEMEDSCRACGENSARPVGDVATQLVQAADVLCVLRGRVVPALRTMAGGSLWHGVERDMPALARDLLTALGEEAT